MEGTNRSLTEQAYDFLKEKLQNCEYMPGEALSEKALCEQLGCGRTPMREAILRLRDEELVEIFPRKGIRAAVFTQSRISEIYQIRKLLEPAVCTQYHMRFDKAALLEFDRRFAAVDRSDDRAYYGLDTQFHRALIAAADNRTLDAFFDGVMQVQYRFGLYSAKLGTAVKGDYYTEHHEIIEALLAEDCPRIARALTAHANYSEVIALRTLAAAAGEK